MFTSKKLSTILALSMLMSFAPSLYGLSDKVKYGLGATAAIATGYSLLQEEGEDTIFETKKGLVTLASAFVAGYFLLSDLDDED